MASTFVALAVTTLTSADMPGRTLSGGASSSTCTANDTTPLLPEALPDGAIALTVPPSDALTAEIVTVAFWPVEILPMSLSTTLVVTWRVLEARLMAAELGAVSPTRTATAGTIPSARAGRGAKAGRARGAARRGVARGSAGSAVDDR